MYPCARLCASCSAICITPSGLSLLLLTSSFVRLSVWYTRRSVPAMTASKRASAARMAATTSGHTPSRSHTRGVTPAGPVPAVRWLHQSTIAVEGMDWGWRGGAATLALYTCRRQRHTQRMMRRG